MLHKDHVVQERAPEFDRDCLHRKLFAVNMRLYQSSIYYQGLIKSVIAYMSWFIDQTWDDYENSTSVGGATLGIPWNIIVLKATNKKVLINPELVEKSFHTVTTWTNNGSLKLASRISVTRFEWVSIRYYDVEGNLQFDEKVDRLRGGFALQHEMDSNNGIMITDRNYQQPCQDYCE